MFNLFKNKKRLIRQMEYYKEHFLSEQKIRRNTERNLRDAEWEIKSLKEENARMDQSNQNLKLESTARLNMYNDEHGKVLKLTKKVDQLEARNASLAEENKRLSHPKKEDHDPYIHE